VTGVESFFAAVVWRDPLGVCYALESDINQMSEIAETLKAWKEPATTWQQQERFEQLMQGLERRPPPPCHIEVGPESLKLTKLTE